MLIAGLLERSARATPAQVERYEGGALLRFAALPGQLTSTPAQPGTAVSVGRAVVDNDWAGAFSMRTRERERRHGYARAVLARLARWAAEHASGLYLQVRLADEPALSLYQHMGFVELGRYHYRQAPW